MARMSILGLDVLRWPRWAFSAWMTLRGRSVPWDVDRDSLLVLSARAGLEVIPQGNLHEPGRRGAHGLAEAAAGDVSFDRRGPEELSVVE